MTARTGLLTTIYFVLLAAVTACGGRAEPIPVGVPDQEAARQQARASALNSRLDGPANSDSGTGISPVFMTLEPGRHACVVHIHPDRPHLYFQMSQWDERGRETLLIDDLPDGSTTYRITLDVQPGREFTAAWLDIWSYSEGKWTIQCD